VTFVPQVPIPHHILALRQEQSRILEYPEERLAERFRDTGFHCSCCGKCCTRKFNDHVFLLDSDANRAIGIDPACLEPAPRPEFCDNRGIFYVSGYALKVQGDYAGSCWFLENNRCTIYEERFSICRAYPFILQRVRGATGIDWHYLSHAGEHRSNDNGIRLENCIAIARQTKERENSILVHQIAFLEFLQDYFSECGYSPSKEEYNRGVRKFSRGEPVTIMVFHNGELEKNVVTGLTGFFE